MRNDYLVSIVKTGAEFLEQVAQPCVAMRLDDGDYPTLGDCTSRGQCGGDLDRMVAIIIDYGDVAEFSGRSKPSFDTGEGL